MTIAAATSRNGQTLTLGAGVTLGHFLVRHHAITVEGAGIDRTTLRADGHYGTMFQAPYPPTTHDGQPVDSLTLSELTVDGDDVASLATLVSSNQDAGPVAIHLSNVRLRNHHRNTTALLSQGVLTASGLCIIGDGGGVKVSAGSTSTIIRSASVVGGLYGFTVALGAPASIPGVDVDGITIDMGLTQSPRFEACAPTGFDATSVYVESHVIAARSLYDTIRVATPLVAFDPQGSLRRGGPQVGDRAETTDRRWTRVTGIGPDGAALFDTWRAAGSWREIVTPDDEATLYRLTFGRLFHWSFDGEPGRLHLQHPSGVPVEAAWRAADGTPMATPAPVPGTLVDVIRHGYNDGQVRDYDVGAVHVTTSALDARISRVSSFDTGSDGQSYRGPGTIVTSCAHTLSRDMGFTVDGSYGPQTIRKCQAIGAGMNGFYVGYGVSRVESCTAVRNGAHGYAEGVYVDDEAIGSIVQVKGSGNARGLCNREVSPGGFDKPRAVRRAVDWRRFR